MAIIKNFHITVRGRVQGVGYRAFATRLAQSMGIRGYVQNKLDGSVFIEAEGTSANLLDFVERCKTGPGWAHVERVDWDEYPQRGFHSFKVKY